jgi:hypothetical protein
MTIALAAMAIKARFGKETHDRLKIFKAHCHLAVK